MSISAVEAPVERFPALAQIPGVRHLFIRRIPGIDIDGERDVVLPRFAEVHDSVRALHGLEGPLVTAKQVHGGDVALVGADHAGPEPVPNVDGLVTRERGVVLAIYVADCCAVYLIDPVTPAIGLVHSGKKGSEREITRHAIGTMCSAFGSNPDEMIVQLSPCIRPPLYETDFAAEIRRQAAACGVRQVHDAGVCTGANVDRYYSYRMEKGKTGRLLALLKLE